MTTPEKYCLIDSSVGAISIALVTGFCPGFSQFKIEILGWAARRTVAKRLKYNDIYSCCPVVPGLETTP